MHEGFSPTSAGDQTNVDPEQSTNYEAGVRFQGELLQASAIGFYSDYETKVTNCSLAFPCGSLTSGSESEGESRIKGLELSLTSTLYQADRFSVPLTLNYTWTDAEITDASGSSNQNGDNLPFVPEHVASAQLGLELASGWNTYLNASYIDSYQHQL